MCGSKELPRLHKRTAVFAANPSTVLVVRCFSCYPVPFGAIQCNPVRSNAIKFDFKMKCFRIGGSELTELTKERLAKSTGGANRAEVSN